MTRLSRRGLAALPFLAAPAAAQPAWPARPIRFVVPWPPGGLNDLIARFFNDRVAQALGQPIVNDFRSGAGGRIGVAEIARAAPDGHTIGMGNLGPLTIFPHLDRNIPYDAARDLVPIVMFCASPLVLVVPPNSPARDVAGLIAAARAAPGRMNYASVGVGTAQHLIFEIFRHRDGIAMEHVPYRGTNESLPAMMQGAVHAMFDTLPLMMPQIQGGAVRAIAVTTPQRLPQLPEVPTMIEAGYPEVDVVTWYAVIAPMGTSAPVQERLFREYTRVAGTPEAQRFLAEQGLIHLPMTQAAFAEHVAAESARWGRLIRDQNIRVE
ncbi:MAG TPA: tripartite tricarboxylate transporter substrate binding protein [Acetobacteraceae bacterium]|nr:tripartite tricarboxylate transporter substrate binding protein [Acetobacteraceae bacterium]